MGRKMEDQLPYAGQRLWLIALISKNTAKADGELWEIQCAYDENVPVMLMWINDERPAVPALLKGKLISVWGWANLKKFIENL
jgi:hypothetical protein